MDHRGILITGANGFVGSAVHHRLRELGKDVRPVVRSERPGYSAIGSIDGATRWEHLLNDVSAVIHLAARAHVLNETASDPQSEFRSVNVDGTLSLARQAAASGVRRFVFISSIGVNGNSSTRPFVELDTPHPVEPYAFSKYSAEQGLRELSLQTSMDICIIRPPLVYGPGAPGNFDRLIGAVARGLPLPLGSINNQRSFIALENLVDFIVTCLEHEAAADETFLISDGEDISTSELLRRLSKALGVSSRIFPFPAWCIEGAGKLLGKQALVQRLCGSLQIDSTKARTVLGWVPPIGLDAALTETARHFLERRTK